MSVGKGTYYFSKMSKHLKIVCLAKRKIAFYGAKDIEIKITGFGDVENSFRWYFEIRKVPNIPTIMIILLHPFCNMVIRQRALTRSDC